jgi:hypothetical protein
MTLIALLNRAGRFTRECLALYISYNCRAEVRSRSVAVHENSLHREPPLASGNALGGKALTLVAGVARARAGA